MYFSVIIPLYNKENHIKKSVESVLKQTYKHFEVIVVDDGSTDSSFQKVNEIDDSRLKIFTKNNEGVSSARNYAIKKSKYNYIALLDADDTWKPEFLESISMVICNFPQAGVYATSYQLVKNEKITHPNIIVDLNHGEADIIDYFRAALSSPLITASSVVIKKSVFDNVGLFSTDLTRGEDLDMWCRIALNYSIVFLNKIMTTYYRDTDNRATANQQEYSSSFMNRAERILKEQKALGNNSIYFEEYMIKRIMNKARYLINKKRGKEARTLLWKYKYTKYNKKEWVKNLILSFETPYLLYKRIK